VRWDEGGRMAVVLPQALSDVSEVRYIAKNSDGYAAVPLRRPSRLADTAPTSPDPHFSVSEYRAVYSARRGIVLVSDSRKGGHGVWSLDLTRGEWSRWLTKAAQQPTSGTLAMGYNASSDVLYALVLDQHSVGKQVNLVAYDHHADSSRVLVSFPYAGKNTHTYLTVLSDGQVVLTASTATHWRAFRFRTTTQGAKFAGSASGRGEVVSTPMMGERDPLLPVFINGTPHPVMLTPGLFSEKHECESL